MTDVQQRWVRVSAFSNRIEAETARSALSSRGIESRLVGDDGGGAGVPLSLEHQGMEVHVAPSDLAPARQLLDLDEDPPAADQVSWAAVALLAAAILAVAAGVAFATLG